ncbi:hypothetical protein A5789_04135 [Nocardia sp. 852002-51101_SCH5132738]|nr:hypothetical protein A5789_04135 [Nocardia sp. 852002-51101_SCH5132738]OBF72699.1 hypothetical protein A9X06_27950 [Mycobacterium sp. 852002-51759_SCH5129042]
MEKEFEGLGLMSIWRVDADTRSEFVQFGKYLTDRPRDFEFVEVWSVHVRRCDLDVWGLRNHTGAFK